MQQIRRILVAIGDLQRAPKNELRKAGTLAPAAGASVELFHAIDPADPARSCPETAAAETVEKLRSAIAARHLRRLERFAHDESLRGASVTCAVMGAVSRSALARLFIGSTAERVLDKLSCDTLIVKPRGFRSELAGRTTAKRESAKGSRASSPRASRQPDSTVTCMRIVLPSLA